MSPAVPALRALAAALLLASLAGGAPSAKDGKQPFSLEDFVQSRFITSAFQGTWVSDTLVRYFNDSTGTVDVYDAKDETSQVIVPQGVLSKYSGATISSFSRDGRLVAISYETIKIYRHSTTSKFVIYDTTTSKEYPVHEGEQLRTLQWAGDSSILWVKDNDVFFRRSATSGQDDYVRITTTGKEGVIFNGVPDWVYEEEVLASGAALWPSPDGTKLAFASFDDTLVNHTFYFKYGGEAGEADPQYPTVVDITYPKVGTANPVVHLKLVDLTNVAADEDVKLIEIPPPAEVTSDFILYGCFWTSNSLLASWTNRVQNLNVISSCDVAGTCRKVLRQSEEAGWVDPPTLKMHSTGRRAAAILPNDDYPHLAVVDFPDDGGNATVTFVTAGNFTVLSILGWDEARAELYYTQTQPEDPAQQHAYRVAVPGLDTNQVQAAEPQCLTCGLRPSAEEGGAACSVGTGYFSSKFSYGILACKGPDVPYYDLYDVQSAEGESPIRFVKTWEDNVLQRLMLELRQRPEYLDAWYPVKDGFRARVRLLLPPGMDKSGATKYPLLVYVYGGPDSNQVSTAFSVGFGDYLCTNRKIIYALIDGRGSGHSGRRRMHAIYRRLGTVEVQDQISVTRQIRDALPYVDPARVAIWGWSYGGFSTAHALAQDGDGVFCCGISVAPVTSFIYYDTIYTERYMGLPTEDDNLEGYNLTDVTRNVENLRHKKYLLVHGNADDNVHYQQSMELSRALEKADIMFQQQSYPDEAHSLAGVKPHVYHTLDEFWTRALHLPPPDWAASAASSRTG